MRRPRVRCPRWRWWAPGSGRGRVTRWADRTWCALSSGGDRRGSGAGRRATDGRHRGQRRRPRPARLADGARRSARGRRGRRVADADPHEEGPPRPHPVRTRRRRTQRRPSATACSRSPARSASASRLVERWALDRGWVDVDVDGATVPVKVAHRDGAVVHATPEFDDVVRLAAERSQPVRDVLAAAVAAAEASGLTPGSRRPRGAAPDAYQRARGPRGRPDEERRDRTGGVRSTSSAARAAHRPRRSPDLKPVRPGRRSARPGDPRRSRCRC